MITGVWQGKINKQKVELKIVLNGDSLEGTSYYYESASNYRRYTIKGYFDPNTNATVWWDDYLLEEKSSRFSLSIPGKIPLLSRADFNCPGDGRMMLDGKSAKREDDTQPRGDVHLNKVPDPLFGDEWDFVIDNYVMGANDPYIIDSIAALSQNPTIVESRDSNPTEEKPVIVLNQRKENPVNTPLQKTVIQNEEVEVVKNLQPFNPPTIQEKFVQRQKKFIAEIPVSGDSVELRFYDNAEIDGDSISLFLNERLIFQHIRLTGNAYIIKLAVSELNSSNELIMVAENLGAIPPNTSYMVALVEDKRYEARLESTEGSSAMIKFVKR